MLELLRKKKSLRILIVAGAAIAALAGAVYLYFHNPHSYPLPCVFYSLTGFYCPGCGAGRASYSLLHGRFLDAFCYNPVMTVLLPLLALYVAARAIDWAITGGDHIDQKISVICSCRAACLHCFKFAAHRKAGKQEAKKAIM